MGRRAGRPAIGTQLTIEKGRIARLALTAARSPSRAAASPGTSSCRWRSGTTTACSFLPVHLNGTSVEVAAARSLAGAALHPAERRRHRLRRVPSRPASLGWLVRKLPDVGDPLTRGAAWVTLWDAMLDAEVRPDQLIELALRALPRETNEQNVQRILGYLNQAYWRFTPDARRAALAPRVERVLKSGLARREDALAEVRVFCDAARRGADAADGEVADRGVAPAAAHSRADARRARLRRARQGAGGPGRSRLEGDPRAADRSGR